MTRTERAASFLFEPARFRYDPAVMRMSPAGRGAYAILFCVGWDMPEPGVLPADDSVLAHLAMVSPETWAEVRNEVAAAYDTTSKPGHWIQCGTVRTASAQKVRFEHLRAAGSAGGKASAATRNQRSVEHGLKQPSTGKVRLGEVRIGEEEAEAARAKRAPTTRSATRPRREPDRSLPPEFVAELASRFRLDLSVVQGLAERLLLEFDARGYRSARSALITWCRREVQNPAPPELSGPKLMPKNGDRHKDLVYWSGAWRSVDQAEHLGWRREA